MKRKEVENQYDEDEPQFKKPLSVSEEQERIRKAVDDLPPGEELDALAIKRMVLAFEKKINQNQLLRAKFGDKPEKFMESELDLDEEIKKLHVLATAPALYPELVKLNTIPSMLSLLSHENADIAADVVGLINELTEPDNFSESEAAPILIDNLLENEALELLVANITRMDEKEETESQAVYNTLSIFENLIELNPKITTIITSKTKIMSWLLNRVKSPDFDDNKLYASEILAILIQDNQDNQAQFAQNNGIDLLLMSLAPYKKRDPTVIEEEEMIENLFDTLCASFQLRENQRIFLKSEGIELMLIMLKQKLFCRKSALKTLDHALMYNPDNCARFVDSLGLKTLFAVLMKGTKKKKGYDEKKDDEHIASIMVSLAKYLEGSHAERFLNKFVESNYEKIERLLEVHLKYNDLVKIVDREIQMKKEEYEEMDEELEDEFYLQRLDAGLFTLQIVDIVIGFVTTKVQGVKSKLAELLRIRGRDLSEIVSTLDEYAKNVGTDGPEGEKAKTFIVDIADKLR